MNDYSNNIIFCCPECGRAGSLVIKLPNGTQGVLTRVEGKRAIMDMGNHRHLFDLRTKIGYASCWECGVELTKENPQSIKHLFLDRQVKELIKRGALRIVEKEMAHG